MKGNRILASVTVAFAVIFWGGLAAGQCGPGGGGSNEDMKRVMTGMKTVTTNLVDADQKLGEKKPDSKEVTPFQTNAAKLGNLNRQLFTMLSDAKCKEEARKINKGVSDLLKYAKKKDSNGMHDGISQIRATCGACHGCPGL